MTSEEHTNSIEQAVESIDDCEALMSISQKDDVMDATISLDNDEFDEDMDAVGALLLMLGCGIDSVSEMTVFDPEEVAVLALEHHDASEQA